MFFPPAPNPIFSQESGKREVGGQLNFHIHFPIPLQLKGKGPAPAVIVGDRSFVARGLGGGPI